MKSFQVYFCGWTPHLKSILKGWLYSRFKSAAGFPGGASGKEPTCQCRRLERQSSGRSLGGGHGNPLQYSCLENPVERKAKSRTRLEATWHTAHTRCWLHSTCKIAAGSLEIKGKGHVHKVLKVFSGVVRKEKFSQLRSRMALYSTVSVNQRFSHISLHLYWGQFKTPKYFHFQTAQASPIQGSHICVNAWCF